MKKLIVLVFVAAVFYNWDSIKAMVQPVPSEPFAGEVVLYATSWCGYCAKTRKLLERYNVPYTEFDVETSEQGLREFRALGGKGVPVLKINDEVIFGFNKDKIIGLIER